MKYHKIIKAEKALKRNKLFRIGIILSGLFSLAFGVVTFYGQDSGNFMMSIDRDAYNRGIVLSTDESFNNPQPRLMTNPIFYVSDHAMIRKVINDQEIHYDFQSEDLSSDFSPMGDQFNFVHYRVYAENFDQNPTHYTDYYIALQDVTNNIRFEITIDNQSLRDFRSIYVSIDICQNEETCHFEDIIYKMSVYATYDHIEDIYKQTHFQTTMHGTYKVDVDLSIGYEYQIILEQSAIDGTSFYLEDSILPRKYYLTIVIVDNDEVIPWGNGHKINQNE